MSFEELWTLIIEVKAVINARPLTYVHDDSEGIDYAITPSHLIYGRKITSLPNGNPFELVSTYETLTRRMKGHRILLWNLLKTWKKDYLLNLRERYSVKQRDTRLNKIEVGDIVIMKDYLTKRLFGKWKLYRNYYLERMDKLELQWYKFPLLAVIPPYLDVV